MSLSMAVSPPPPIPSPNTTNKRLDYPAYELYTDVLRKGIFDGEKGRQLRLVVGEDRRVREVVEI